MQRPSAVQLRVRDDRPEFRLGHRPALDGLRGVSILAVMAFHARLPFAVGGFLGVDAFFVLSGFLITSLLYEEWTRTGAIRLLRFYARRALRLLPALFVLLLAYGAYVSFLPPFARAGSMREIVFTALYVANWAQVFGWVPYLGVLSHTWSLAIEEQFYLLWPLALLAMLRLRLSRGAMLGLMAGAIGTSMLLRAVLWQGPQTFPRVFFGFDTRADSLLVGCVIGLCAHWDIVPRSPRSRRGARYAAIIATLLTAGLLMRMSLHDTSMFRGGITVVAVAIGAIIIEIIASPEGRIARVLGSSLLVKVGRISYGLYLWHWPVFLFLASERTESNLLPTTLLRFCVTFAIAIASFLCVERPFLRMKERYAVV